MKKIVIGFIIMLFGAFLLLKNMGLFFIPEVYHYIISWQSLLIAIGVILLVDRPANHKIAGVVLILVGALFLMSKIFSISIGSFIIPVIIIAIGIGIIIKSTGGRSLTKDFESWNNGQYDWKKYVPDFEKTGITENGDVTRKSYVFSNSKEKWTQGKLKDVEIDAVFSGVELDFTQAELADDITVAAHIKVSSVFSGVTLYVPDDWNIVVQKTGVFGGFTDNRPNRVLQVSSEKFVVLEVEAVFGGGEIRCYE